MRYSRTLIHTSVGSVPVRETLAEITSSLQYGTGVADGGSFLLEVTTEYGRKALVPYEQVVWMRETST